MKVITELFSKKKRFSRNCCSKCHSAFTCSKLTIETLRLTPCFSVSIYNFEHVTAILEEYQSEMKTSKKDKSHFSPPLIKRIIS